MSFLDNTEWSSDVWGTGVAALENLISFGTEPLMYAVQALLEAKGEDRNFFLIVLQEKVEDMEKNIKRFMVELKQAETSSKVAEGGAA